MIDRIAAAVWCALAITVAVPLRAQTDYYNTDLGRPVRIEDASPVERYAFELQLAPLRVERAAGGAYDWELAPEIAYGILPGTQVELAFPLRAPDGADAGGARGLAGIHLSALHKLNVETRSLPAMAVAAGIELPVGSLGPSTARPSVTGIATRTFAFGRLHANAGYTFRRGIGDGEEIDEVNRWMAGVAADRVFPLRSLLAIVDLFAEQPLDGDQPLRWTAEAGLRYQTSPQFNLDVGIGRRFAGRERSWSFTFGLAHAFALRGLMPR